MEDLYKVHSYFNMSIREQRYVHLKLLYCLAERKQLELMVQEYELKNSHRSTCLEMLRLRDHLALDWMKLLYKTTPDLWEISAVFFPHLYAAIDDPLAFCQFLT